MPSSPPARARSKARPNPPQIATAHGLSGHRLAGNSLASGCFLHTEDEAKFRILLTEYIATYNPQHRDEYDLLTEAVYAKWRQQRIWLAQTAQIEVAIALNEPKLQKDLPTADPAAHLANGIAHSEKLMNLYLRYDAQLHRQYLRCLKERRALQGKRQNERQASRQHSKPPDRQEADRDQPEPPNEPKPAAPEAGITTPNEPNLTPEQARLDYMKGEIKRFDDYQARDTGAIAGVKKFCF